MKHSGQIKCIYSPRMIRKSMKKAPAGDSLPAGAFCCLLSLFYNTSSYFIVFAFEINPHIL